MNLIKDLVNDIIEAHYIYISECERNSTEVKKNIAILKVKTKELQANIELATNYFQHQMQERERLFTSASKVLDKAIKNGDIEFAQIAIKAMEVIHKKSPFSYKL